MKLFKKFNKYALLEYDVDSLWNRVAVLEDEYETLIKRIKKIEKKSNITCPYCDNKTQITKQGLCMWCQNNLEKKVKSKK